MYVPVAASGRHDPTTDECTSGKGPAERLSESGHPVGEDSEEGSGSSSLQKKEKLFPPQTNISNILCV
jgi:hypothetical protein